MLWEKQRKLRRWRRNWPKTTIFTLTRSEDAGKLAIICKQCAKRIMTGCGGMEARPSTHSPYIYLSIDCSAWSEIRNTRRVTHFQVVFLSAFCLCSCRLFHVSRYWCMHIQIYVFVCVCMCVYMSRTDCAQFLSKQQVSRQISSQQLQELST